MNPLSFEVGGRWELFFLALALDVGTIVVAFFMAAWLATRFLEDDRSRVPIAVALAAEFFAYTFFLRPLLLEEPVFRALPYLFACASALLLVPAVFATSRLRALAELREYFAPMTPDVGWPLILASVSVGTLLMLVTYPYAVGHWQMPTSWHARGIDDAVRTLFDAALLQLASIAVLVFQARSYYSKVASRRRELPPLAVFTAYFLSILVVTLTATVILDVSLVRPSFEISQRPNAVPEGWLISYLAGLLRLDGLSNTQLQAPSVLAMNQAVVFMMYQLLACQRGWRTVLGRRDRYLFQFVQCALLLLVLAGRVYSQQGGPREIAVGIAVALIVFWWLAAVGAFLMKSVSHYKLLPLALLPLAILAIGIWLACDRKEQWLAASLGLLLVYFLMFGVLYLIRSAIKGLSNPPKSVWVS